MATAISKPASHPPPKMKRPPPPLVSTGVNGVKPQQPSSASSPSSASKRLPGSGQPAAANATSSPMANGVNGASYLTNNKGPLNRTKKDAQKPGDQQTQMQRPLLRTTSTENDRRIGKKCPEPYGKALAEVVGLLCGLLTFTASSENNATHPEKICKASSFPHCTPSSDPFSLRATRWEFPL